MSADNDNSAAWFQISFQDDQRQKGGYLILLVSKFQVMKCLLIHNPGEDEHGEPLGCDRKDGNADRNLAPAPWETAS